MFKLPRISKAAMSGLFYVNKMGISRLRAAGVCQKTFLCTLSGDKTSVGPNKN